jgi:hypothetical protein
MLARYTMKRGTPREELPQGVRQDTRKHTRHCLRPPAAAVERFLASPDASAWTAFAAEYRATIERRHRKDRRPFDDRAALARGHDVYLGCNCPTKKNPDVNRCHTMLALRFMQASYADLDVRFP